MPKASLTQNNFSGGVLSPLFSARTESELHQQGLDTCENYVPIVQGPVLRRPGTEYGFEVQNSSKFTRLIPFIFSNTQEYMIELSDARFAILVDGAPVVRTTKTITGATQANPCVITSAGHALSNGDEVYITGVVGMTQLNRRRFVIAGVTANTFQLVGCDSTAYTAYSSGGTASVLVSYVGVYTEAQLPDVKFAQSGDVLYLTHPSWPPYTITRLSSTAWYLTLFSTTSGPFQPEIPAVTSLSVARTGAGPYTYTFTAGSAIFVDCTAKGYKQRIRFQITTGAGTLWYDGELTFTSTTVAYVTNIAEMSTATPYNTEYRLGMWYIDNYPSFVLFHEDRLCFGGYTDFPGHVDLSETGGYTSFSIFESSGTVIDSNALSLTLAQRELDLAYWGMSDESGLFIGTTDSEFVIRVSNYGEALTPTNANAKQILGHGSSGVAPLLAGKSIIFVQGLGRKLRELIASSDRAIAEDLTRAAEHISLGGINELAYQKEPFPIVWAVRDDGALLSMTYERIGEILKAGWAEHWLGGVSDAAGNPAAVESIGVIRDSTGTREELWMVVKRYINGSTKRYIERLSPFFMSDVAQEDATFTDCFLTYDSPKTISGATKANPCVVTATSHGFSNGDYVLINDVAGMDELNGNSYLIANVAANTFELSGIDSTSFTTYVSGGEARKKVTSISGLDHLEGEIVQILADGAPQAEKTVSSGAITLSSRAAKVHIGLGYTSKLKTLRANTSAPGQSSHGKIRRVTEVILDLYRTLGMKLGKSFDSLNTIQFRTSSSLMGHAPDLFTGFKREAINFDHDQDNQICIQQDQPTPGIIRAITYDVKGE
jgi:hypothetical protein